MKFEIAKSIEILERTPQVLNSLLLGISEEWLFNNEGENTWSPYDVVGHLIQGEKTDWMNRTKIILSDKENKSFEPFDRFAQMTAAKKPINELLDEFQELRTANILALKSMAITEEKLEMAGIHPALGKATLKELLSTWVVHDLGHISQISRVMARQYQEEVGPWAQYLGILK